MTPFRFHPEAATETYSAAEYYDANIDGLGLEFLSDLEQCIAIAREFPDSGTPYEADTRRLLLRRFPFSLVYVSEPNQVTIVAVAHQRRNPGYWRRRME